MTYDANIFRKRNSTLKTNTSIFPSLPKEPSQRRVSFIDQQPSQTLQTPQTPQTPQTHTLTPKLDSYNFDTFGDFSDFRSLDRNSYTTYNNDISKYDCKAYYHNFLYNTKLEPLKPKITKKYNLTTQSLCNYAVMDSDVGWILKDINEIFKTKEICEICVKKNGDALQYVPYHLKTKELCELAIENDIVGNVLEFVPEHLKTVELCNLAIKRNKFAKKYIK
jgi:hypothetical protein